MPPQKKNVSPSFSRDTGSYGLAEVKAAESELRRQRELLRRKRKRLLDFVGDVAFILFVWAVPDTTPCAAYLESQRVSERDSAFTLEEIQQRYLQASVADLNAIADRAKQVGQRKLQAAARFQREFSLARWVEKENTTKGNAPTVALVQAQLSRELDPVTAQTSASHSSASSLVSTKWVQRFRKRWKLTRGRFPAREHVPLEVLRCKASV